MPWTEHVARITENRNAYKFLIRKPEGKILSRKIRFGLEDNIKFKIMLSVYLVQVGKGGEVLRRRGGFSPMTLV
jgi:hypothetical protein